MRSITSRTTSVLMSLALIAAAIGMGSLASAATGGPTVVLSSTSATTTNATSLPITATFSQDVTGFTSGDVIATNATISAFSGTGPSYSFNLIPTATGTVTASISADVASSTAAGTLGNQASNMLTFTITTMSTATSSLPVIAHIAAESTGSTTETITWTTDVPATSQVFYGSTTSYDASSTLDTALSTLHTSFLGGLIPSAVYHFAVVSTNASGTATSSDQTFTAGTTTVATTTATSTPLAVTSVDAVSTTAVADGTFANGWKWIIHFVIPENETSFQLKFADFTSSSSSATIPIAGNMRYYSAQSSNATSSSSAIVETDTGYGGAMTLTGDASATTAGRQVDVTIEAAIPSGTPTGTYSTTYGALSM